MKKRILLKDIYEEDELIHKLVDFIVGKEMLAIGDEKSETTS